jgi:hypothetical protein
MKRERFFYQIFVLTVCGSLLIPRIGLSEEAIRAISDVALGAGGSLHGQVVDTAGQPVSGTEVQAITGGQSVGKTTTDQEGKFHLTGLRGGLYQVSVADNRGVVVRAWSDGTAPPAARSAVLMVQGDTTVRGGFQMLANPWVLAGIAAAAIIIPLTLDDDDAS